MANIPIWPGSSSFAAVSASYYNTPSTGSSPTPFGFYDNDSDFKTDANKVANFCSRRLGYPIENVELQDLNFWTAFEEATTVYGNELYAYQVRENMLNLEGLPITTPVGLSLTFKLPAQFRNRCSEASMIFSSSAKTEPVSA
jgi:hypothetical protein